MAIEEYYESQSKAGKGDEDYARAIDRSMTIDSIIALNPVFKREYLNSRDLDSLHDLEDSLLNTTYETP